MTINQALFKYQNLEIDLLLANILGQSKEFLYMNPEGKLTSMQVRKLVSMVRRREKGEPVAYILGHKDFMGLKFKVNKDVLIPRPETEAIIERLKDLEFKDFKQPIRILDIGTGSGCMAVSLAKLLKGSRSMMQVTACDISKKALIVARQNSKIHKVNIKFINSNLLRNIKSDFDVIVANLPYLSRDWISGKTQETLGLKFEPKQALFTANKGLFIINKLLNQISKLKNKPSLLYLEFDPRQKNELQKTIKKILPESKAGFFRDLNNLWRFVEVKIK